VRPARSGRVLSVLVPVDGPEGASSALLVARELSRLEGATPRLLYVSERVTDPRSAAELLGLNPEDLHGVTIDARRGDLHAEILRQARVEATRLIVLCPALGGRRPPAEMGAVVDALLGDAPCPIVLVPPGSGGASWRLREVLLPHDGTPTAARGVRRASDLARSAGAWLRVLHVATSAGASSEPGSLAAPRYVDQPQHEWPAWAREFLERLSGVCRLDLDRLRLVLGHGDPGDEVLRVARDSPPDLILLAWRGSADPGHGKTVRTVLAGARCPVMVVRVLRSPAQLGP
jgi:nucleotide-binding universal stress UspA family protein